MQLATCRSIWILERFKVQYREEEVKIKQGKSRSTTGGDALAVGDRMTKDHLDISKLTSIILSCVELK